MVAPLNPQQELGPHRPRRISPTCAMAARQWEQKSSSACARAAADVGRRRFAAPPGRFSNPVAAPDPLAKDTGLAWMSPFFYIVVGGIAMSALALTGAVTLLLRDETLARLIRPLVAFSAGSLLGGAFFHMMPEAITPQSGPVRPFAWLMLGFGVFFALEQFLHWHHCHRAEADCRQPLTYLVLIGDAVHNFVGGLAVAGAFMVDVRVGVAAWLAAAAHEVPQELGDFGVLVHGGLSKGKALLFNLLSASTFLLGGLVTYALSFRIDTAFLLPFAAGNFIYIAASDLVPQVNRHHRLSHNVIHFVAFAGGASFLLLTKLAFES